MSQHDRPPEILKTISETKHPREETRSNLSKELTGKKCIARLPDLMKGETIGRSLPTGGLHMSGFVVAAGPETVPPSRFSGALPET
jgi:hypothetical protein